MTEPVLIYGWVGRTEEYIGSNMLDEWHHASEILNPQGYFLNREGDLVYSKGEITEYFIFDQKIQTRFKRQASRVWQFEVDVPSVRLYAVVWENPLGDHPLWDYTLEEFNLCL